MILKGSEIAHQIEEGQSPDSTDPLVITPLPDVNAIRQSGTASLDLHLGTWFRTLRRARIECMKTTHSESRTGGEQLFTKEHYIPFGKSFFLHPRSFALGITLEWMRLPKDLAAVVTGKSSWGRRGLIIATATGVHPGFSGCLTLEITNLGEIPVEIKPGYPICQLFIHQVFGKEDDRAAKSAFALRRKPIFGAAPTDPMSSLLCKQDG